MTEIELNNIKEKLAILIKNKRIEQRLSRAELAKRTGLGIATINRLENKTSWPGLKQFVIVCDELSITII